MDIIPAQFRVIVTRRPKHACRSCEGGIVQAPAPAHIIAGGMPTEVTLAHVLVSKYADHLPLYRQAQIYSRQGIDLDRSTLAAWVGKSALELTPVYNALMADLKRSTKIFMDETPAPVLPPGRKRPKLDTSRPLLAMIAHGAVTIHLEWRLPMRLGDPASMQTRFCKASAAPCRWTAMLAITACSNGPLRMWYWPIAGLTRGVNCTMSPSPAQPRSRRKAWVKSRHSIVSKKTCAVRPPTNASPHDKNSQNLLSMHSKAGSPKTVPASLPSHRPGRP